MIRIKDTEIFSTLLSRIYHPVLIDIIIWLEETHEPDEKVIITSGYRGGDPGCHGTNPCRAIDIRSRTYKNPERIVEEINDRWIYDPARPEKKCAMVHDVGQGKHIHFQVHPNTRRR